MLSWLPRPPRSEGLFKEVEFVEVKGVPEAISAELRVSISQIRDILKYENNTFVSSSSFPRFRWHELSVNVTQIVNSGIINICGNI